MGIKHKAVINADAAQLAAAEALVRAGRYRSVSQLFREALAEKLASVAREDLRRQVEAYCDDGHADEDRSLIDAQAFPGRPRRAAR